MRFHMEDNSLNILFEGVERLWALKNTLRIPKSDIVSIEWLDAELLSRQELGWRMGGAGVANILYAGRFVGSQGLNFVYLRQPKAEASGLRLRHVLTIELRDNKYRRVLITLDKPDIAERISAWWQNT